MKRFAFILFLCTTFVCSIFAEDVIITRDAEKINAIVTEVSETEVKYKKVDNPNGPVFVIATAKIASIMYQNGDVQTFKEQPAAQTNQVKYYETQPTYDLWGNADYGAALGAMNANNIPFIPGQTIVPTNTGYGYGDVHMDNNTYAAFLKRTCPDASMVYEAGKVAEVIGVGFCSAAAAIGFWALIWMSIDPSLETSKSYAIGISVSVGASLALGVPLWVIGAKNKKRSVEMFNTSCGLEQAPPVTMSLNASQNGIGLALNF